MIPVSFSCHFSLVTWLMTSNAESRRPYLMLITGKHWLSLLFMILVIIRSSNCFLRGHSFYTQLKFCIKNFVQCWGDGSVDTCAAKPDNLAHLVKRENKVLLVVAWPPYMCHSIHKYWCMCTQTLQTSKCNKNIVEPCQVCFPLLRWWCGLCHLFHQLIVLSVFLTNLTQHHKSKCQARSVRFLLRCQSFACIL